MEGLFLNADAGFDSKDFRKSCYKREVNTNVFFNELNGNAVRYEYLNMAPYDQKYTVECPMLG